MIAGPTPLEKRLLRLIEAGGPINIAAFMALALGDPEHGYYMRREALGAKGDFTTAPEVSQLFGEMIAVHLALVIERLPPDGPLNLVEFGPGRGTLMADMLRTLGKLRPAAVKRMRVVMVETSGRLRDLQRKAVSHLAEPEFHDSLQTLRLDGPVLAVGNEFLDALPFRQFVKQGSAWRERVVIAEDGALAFGLGDAVLGAADLPPVCSGAPEGAVFEIAPAREAFIATLAARLARNGGTALFIDYGHARPGIGDTLQAVRDHAPAPVLAAVGLADITSHVDFAPLLAIATREGCATGILSQGEFLLGAGILQRAGRLGAGLDDSARENLRQAVERLAGSDTAHGQMGSLFKVAAFAAGAAASGGLSAPFAGHGLPVNAGNAIDWA
jgi:SAM-dependent MidA family methyltransferase